MLKTLDSCNFASNVDMIYFNSQVEAVKSPVWSELRGATSVALIYYLLTTAALFKPLPNNNMLQISGTAIDVTAKLLKQSPKKEKTLPVPLHSSMANARHISFKKASIVYSNPFFFSAEKRVRYGLPPYRELCAEVTSQDVNGL